MSLSCRCVAVVVVAVVVVVVAAVVVLSVVAMYIVTVCSIRRVQIRRHPRRFQKPRELAGPTGLAMRKVKRIVKYVAGAADYGTGIRKDDKAWDQIDV